MIYSKMFCTHPYSTVTAPSASPPVCLHCYNFCHPSHPHSLILALHFIFLHLVFLYAAIVLRQGYCNKTYVQQSEHSSSTIHTCLQSNFSVECRYRGITASHLSSPQYYREIFPVPAVITGVTAVLPLSPSVSCSSRGTFL